MWERNDRLGTARVVSKAQDKGAAILGQDEAVARTVYVSPMPTFIGHGTDKQFLDNAITWVDPAAAAR